MTSASCRAPAGWPRNGGARTPSPPPRLHHHLLGARPHHHRPLLLSSCHCQTMKSVWTHGMRTRWCATATWTMYLERWRLLPTMQIVYLMSSTFAEADKDEPWRAALKPEENDTWQLVDLPRHNCPIGLKWVFKLLKKIEADDIIKHTAHSSPRAMSSSWG
jgi:hypothetical protein